MKKIKKAAITSIIAMPLIMGAASNINENISNTGNEINLQSEKKIKTTIEIEGQFTVKEIVGDSVTFDYSYGAGIPDGKTIMGYHVISTNQEIVQQIGIFGNPATAIIHGFKPGQIYEGARLALFDDQGDEYVFGDPVQIIVPATVPTLSEPSVNLVRETDLVEYTFDFKSNGAKIEKVVFKDPLNSVEIEIPNTLVDGENTYTYDSNLALTKIKGELYVHYTLEGSTEVTEGLLFDEVTTGDIIIIDNGTSFNNIESGDATLNWNFTNLLDITLSKLTITGKEADADFTEYELSGTEGKGSETMSGLKPNTLYSELKLNIYYLNSATPYSISIGDFSTTNVGPEIISSSWSEIKENSAKLSWELEDNGNVINGITIDGNAGEEVISYDIPKEDISKGETIITGLEPNTHYWDLVLVVNYGSEIEPQTYSYHIDDINTISGTPEIATMTIDNVGSQSARVNWTIDTKGSTINEIKLKYKESPISDPETIVEGEYTLESTSPLGNETIYNLNPETRYFEIVAIINYTNNAMPPLTTDTLPYNVAEFQTTDSGPELISLTKIEAGNTQARISYDIDQKGHEIVKQTLRAKYTNLDTSVQGDLPPVDLGTESTGEILLTNLNINSIYYDFYIEIEDSTGAIFETDIKTADLSILTKRYVEKISIEENAFGIQLFSYVFDSGIREYENAEILLTDSKGTKLELEVENLIGNVALAGKLEGKVTVEIKMNFNDSFDPNPYTYVGEINI